MKRIADYFNRIGKEGVEQPQLGENYKFRRDAFLGWVLMDFHKDAWSDLYSFTEEPQIMVDFIL